MCMSMCAQSMQLSSTPISCVIGCVPPGFTFTSLAPPPPPPPPGFTITSLAPGAHTKLYYPRGSHQTSSPLGFTPNFTTPGVHTKLHHPWGSHQTKLNFLSCSLSSVVRGFLARRKCQRLRLERRSAAATQLQRGQLLLLLCC